MSSILYYSNFCEHSKKLLQTLSKANIHQDMHFICIDKRVKDSNNKMFIVLENGQKIIMPENVNRVPALLLLNQGYNVLYGESILQHLRPKQEVAVRQATQNNMEPMAFSFGEGTAGVASDNFSFLDMSSDSLAATGDGGLRQMYNYVSVDYQNVAINTPTEDFNARKTNMSMEQLQKQRDMDVTR